MPLAERAAVTATFGSFLAPLTTSLKLWPALNFGTDVFLILTAAPVRGLRPVRAGRATFSKTPKPVMATRSPGGDRAGDRVEYGVDRVVGGLLAAELTGQLVDQLSLVHVSTLRGC